MERLVGNPVHVYTLLWRLVTRLPGLRAEVGPRLAEEIEDITSELEMPDLSDVEGATQALVRIQFAYRCGLLVPGRYHWHCTVAPTTDPCADWTLRPWPEVTSTEWTLRRG